MLCSAPTCLQAVGGGIMPTKKWEELDHVARARETGDWATAILVKAGLKPKYGAGRKSDLWFVACAVGELKKRWPDMTDYEMARRLKDLFPQKYFDTFIDSIERSIRKARAKYPEQASPRV
jgi:hypothetical protein